VTIDEPEELLNVPPRPVFVSSKDIRPPEFSQRSSSATDSASESGSQPRPVGKGKVVDN